MNHKTRLPGRDATIAPLPGDSTDQLLTDIGKMTFQGLDDFAAARLVIFPESAGSTQTSLSGLRKMVFSGAAGGTDTMVVHLSDGSAEMFAVAKIREMTVTPPVSARRGGCVSGHGSERVVIRPAGTALHMTVRVTQPGMLRVATYSTAGRLVLTPVELHVEPGTRSFTVHRHCDGISSRKISFVKVTLAGQDYCRKAISIR